ncbi:MAG: N-acetylmuramidase family protein [Rhodospirillaceae bacterium]|nr:N-acetylmuramidase family protein [Rhodospirillaceae bacterium]
MPNRRPKILFERHIFHQRTNGKFDATHPDISHPKWGEYGKASAQYDRLGRAMALDRQAALESASWGLPQVMGFNAVSSAMQAWRR